MLQETWIELKESASRLGLTDSPFQTSHALTTCSLIFHGIRQFLRSQVQKRCGYVYTFLGVFIQARWLKWESTDTATTSQFTS